MNILYSDENLIVCIKPVGADSEKQFPNLISEHIGGEVYTVHRLDMNVGGVMVYARNKQTAAYLSKIIGQGDMIKEYVACVHGTPENDGVLEDFLFKDSRKNKVFTAKKQRAGVKYAKLEFKKLTDSNPCLVHIRLYTGRSHQIRVQFASRGFPLVGDHKYGSRSTLKSPMLYSSKITFPYKNNIMTFESKPDWANIQE